ncbi:MAG: hypothetical protein ACJAQ6_001493, partial [Arenicella sp.]
PVLNLLSSCAKFIVILSEAKDLIVKKHKK